MFSQWFGYEAKRKRLLAKAPPGPLKEYLSVPFPDPATRLNQTPILALDFETTGLDAKTDQILSVGHITIESFEILLASAYHQIICTRGDLKEESVVIHQITDDTKSSGQGAEEVIEKLLQAMAGKVILVHFAQIEKNFLQYTCKKLYGMAPVFPIIDTLVLARKRLDQRTALYSPNDLRLFNLRENFQLPRYRAHNALSDALATAELFLAEIELKQQMKSPRLKSVIL
ncbi:MAG: DNA polymerase III subunit epsilon [gamma proteobacterium symbiont of Taylorina sp.]|nr:DNA polymerase III subunit epsilon [gamma proteobacterium symbiont of Taylorina sp.]